MEVRAARFLADVRGTADTAWLSGRLGYAHDVVADWERGKRWPTASETLRACRLCRLDVNAAFERFDVTIASALGEADDAGVASWCAALCAGRDPRTLARTLGRPMMTVQRWLRGQVRPTLPEFLLLVEAATGESERLLRCLLPLPEPVQTPPEQVARERTASARGQVLQALQTARRARKAPPRLQPVAPPTEDLGPEDEVTVEVFSEEPAAPPQVEDLTERRVWRAVASADHEVLGRERPGWLAARCRLADDAVEHALDRLSAAGAVSWEGDRWVALDPPHEEDRPQEAGAAGDPLDRLERARGDQVVLSVSEDDVARIRALHAHTRAELHAIEASSQPKQVLLLVRAPQ